MQVKEGGRRRPSLVHISPQWRAEIKYGMNKDIMLFKIQIIQEKQDYRIQDAKKTVSPYIHEITE